MGKRYPHITTTSVHPGVVRTNLPNNAYGAPLAVRSLAKVFRVFLMPVDRGARNQLWASVGKGVKSGDYYEPVGTLGRETSLMKDTDLAEKLWDWTEKEFKMGLQV
jgi:retinol dehydrogenase-12